MIGDMCVL